MATFSRLTMGDILSRFGSTMLSVLTGVVDRDGIVNSVTFYDPLEPPSASSGALVLGIGLDSDEEISEALDRLDAEKAVALVVRESAGARQLRPGRRTIVLELARSASWTQLTTMLSAGLELSRRQISSFADGGDSETDLFELANSLADMLGGPVTIEDMSSRIHAFSADQAQADEPRKQNVLGRQVSRKHNDVLEQVGVFAEIYSSSKPVFVPSIVEGSRPRMAMRIRAGSENLGSIWAIVDKPLTEARQQAFIEGANVVALSMVRRQIIADAGARLRSALVARLIEGGQAAVEAAEQLGTVDGLSCVLAIAPIEALEHEPGREADLESTARSLAAFLNMAEPRAVSSLVGRTIYAIVPLRAGSGTSSARELAAGFLKRVPASEQLAIGISDPADDVASLAAFRRQADVALRVLRLPRRRGTQVATHAEIQMDALLLRLGDLLAAEHQQLGGPLGALADYDAANDGSMVATVAAHLDAFGDVASAAAAVHVHPNTFRYRLKRIEEIAGISLADPDTRLTLALQLRLGEQSRS